MQVSVNERVNFLVDTLKGGNKSAFAKDIGVGGGVVQDIVAGRLNKPSFDVLTKIVNTYPNISLDWLVLGKGQPFKSEVPQLTISNESPVNYKIKTEFIVATQDTHGNSTIPIVTHKAAANYLQGYHSQEYFENLEPMTLPRFMINGGQHAVWQVQGESMEPTFFDGEYVICTRVEQHEWLGIKDLEVFVVISERLGVQLKRVKNRLKHKQFMRFKSDNKAHKDFSLTGDEILELWRFQWKLSPYAVNRAEQLYKKVDDLEDTVSNMQELLEAISKQIKIGNSK